MILKNDTKTLLIYKDLQERKNKMIPMILKNDTKDEIFGIKTKMIPKTLLIYKDLRETKKYL